MLWVKALHIVFVVSGSPACSTCRASSSTAMETDAAALQRLLLMARKLYRFMTILAVPALAFGLWLYLGYGIGRGPGQGWMHTKLALVLVLIGYHHGCGVLLRKFEAGRNTRSHTFYRWFNELPVLVLLAVVIPVVKPF